MRRRKPTWKISDHLEIRYVGDYVGNGNGDSEEAEVDDGDEVSMETEPSHVITELEDTIADAHPLLFFFDCETTGFSIYSDHITEIAAKVVAVPQACISKPTYGSLVHTARNIPKKGKCVSLQHAQLP